MDKQYLVERHFGKTVHWTLLSLDSNVWESRTLPGNASRPSVKDGLFAFYFVKNLFASLSIGNYNSRLQLRLWPSFIGSLSNGVGE